MANDPTVKAGSWGARTVEKIVRLTEHALRDELPVFWLVDSAGARITDQVELFPGRRGAGRIFYNQVRLSGRVPQVCCLFGPSAAGGAYIPSFCDLVVMVEGNASMYLGSPRMAEMVIGEITTLEEMGGARMHATVSGCGDNLAVDDADAIEQARAWFSYLPDRGATSRPSTRPSLRPGRSPRTSCRPRRRRATTCTSLIEGLVDAESFFEIKPLFAPELVVGLARLDGRPVGIVANNPLHKGGVLFVDSADKAARFIWFCDAFNIPLVFLADVPGFMVGTEVERQGIIRHGAKMITAVAEATVPKVSVIVRKAYGAGLYAMAGPGVRPRGHARPAHGQDRGDGPRGRGQRRVRQPHRRHRRRRRAGGLRGRAAAPLRGGRRPVPPGRRSWSSTRSCPSASCATRSCAAWPTPAGRRRASPSATTACRRSDPRPTVPWCEDCSKFWNPNSMPPDGTCPTLRAAHRRGAERAEGAVALLDPHRRRWPLPGLAGDPGRRVADPPLTTAAPDRGPAASDYSGSFTGCGAAWLARRSGGPKVVGSNPASPTRIPQVRGSRSPARVRAWPPSPRLVRESARSFAVRLLEAIGERLVQRRQQVAVGVERDRDRAVTEPLLDRQRVRALGDQERYGGVPQVVEAHWPSPRDHLGPPASPPPAGTSAGRSCD